MKESYQIKNIAKRFIPSILNPQSSILNFYRTRMIIGLLLSLFIPCFCFASSLKITDFQTLNINGHTRLVFSLSEPFHYRIFHSSNPARVTLYFYRAFSNISFQTNTKDSVLVKSVKTSQEKNQLDVTVYLNKAASPMPFIQRPRGRYGYRLMVDLVPEKVTQLKTVKTPVKENPINTVAKPSAVALPKKPTMTLSSDDYHDAVIVIDPGHGGKDPGATGPDSIHEKNVVLAIATDLYNDLKQEPGIVPKMTRSGDYFVTLRGRLSLARKGKADLFMAIHADAYKDPYARGASVFALSQRGATNEAARWLAQKENYSELGGVDLEDKSYMLRSVLLDLSQTETIRESLDFGHDVIGALNGVAKLHHGFVEQAPFVVLKSPDIPSLLVETGFISNKYEADLLNNSDYEQRMAHALMLGILHYLEQYPPKGTLFDLKSRGMTHVVKPGETLNVLARYYDVSVSDIEQLNHLNNSILSIGQIVKIPKGAS